MKEFNHPTFMKWLQEQREMLEKGIDLKEGDRVYTEVTMEKLLPKIEVLNDMDKEDASRICNTLRDRHSQNNITLKKIQTLNAELDVPGENKPIKVPMYILKKLIPTMS